MDEAMEDCFGFTEDEVKEMASHFGLEGEMDGIRNWYNGYLFGGDMVIYNPWSIVNYLRNPGAGFIPHWINTSSNALVQKMLQMDRAASRETVLQLLGGQELRKEVYRNIAYQEISSNPDAALELFAAQRLFEGHRQAAARIHPGLSLVHTKQRGSLHLQPHHSVLAEDGTTRRR